MSISPTGWNAIFKPYRIEPVVGWDEFGVATVVDAALGRRVPVDELNDFEFESLEPADPPYIGVLPANGWTIHWADGETTPLIGFAVLPSGLTLPLVPEPTSGQARPYIAADGDPAAHLVPPRGAA